METLKTLKFNANVRLLNFIFKINNEKDNVDNHGKMKVIIIMKHVPFWHFCNKAYKCF